MCFAYSLVETIVAENKQMLASVLVGGVLTLGAGYMISTGAYCLVKDTEWAEYLILSCPPSNPDQHYTYSQQK